MNGKEIAASAGNDRIMAPARKDTAVLFDLDGTLLNTLRDISDSMNCALSSFGLPPWEKDAYRYLVGNGARVLAERAVRDRQDLAEQVLQAYQNQYDRALLDHTVPYPGIPEMLRQLTERRVPLFVLSNKPDANTREIISSCFPDIPFRHVQGQLPAFPRKPDPTAALTIARQVGIAPEKFFYLGDTSVDMECARRAGMRPVGVLWGFRTRTELQGSGAEFLLKDPMELPELIPKEE